MTLYLMELLDRPAWDIAEVTIDLDNTDRQAPSLFNQSDEIEVHETYLARGRF